MTVAFFEIAFASVLLAMGGACGVAAIDASRPGRRLLRDRTSKVADLKSGPAQIAGELRAIAPLVTLDGSLAVAIHQSIHCTYRQTGDDSGTRSLEVIHTECSDIEVIDEGSYVIEMDGMLLLGPTKRHLFRVADLEAQFPELWSKLPPPDNAASLEEVIVAETVVRDGDRGIVSGEATLSDVPSKGDGYRDGKRLLKLRGDDRRPLIVSSFSKKRVVWILLAPALRVAFVAIVCWLVAVLAIAFPLWLEARTRLPP